MKTTKDRLESYFPALFIITATLMMVLFTYLTPPILEKPLFPFLSVMKTLHGDYPLYISRFILSLVLLGIVPFLTAIVSGLSPAELGLNINIKPFKPHHLIIFLVIAAFFGITGGLSEELASFYPYSRTLLEDTAGERGYLFILHIICYGIFYYLPWELFFRGFLMLAFISRFEKSLSQNKSLLLLVLAFQTIPSTLLHFGHPMTELLSAIPAGIFFGWLVYKTRSIFPAFLLHFTVGIATDTTIFLQHWSI